MKIYPAFYFFLVIGWLIDRHKWEHTLTPDAVFISNYIHGLWSHTWSLAVEEHFYILLPLVLVWLLRNRNLRWIPTIAPALLLACLALRLITLHFSNDFHYVTYPTHLRVDALFVGVALSYLGHFHGNILRRASHWSMLPLGISLVFPAAVLPRDSALVMTVGLSLNAIGFGCILIWSLTRPFRFEPIEQIGRCSYSIYLWQVIVLSACRSTRVSLANLAFCVAMTVAIGIAMSEIVERPALYLRERIALIRPASIGKTFTAAAD